MTYEFENVPAEAATFLALRVPALPDPQVLATTQDRLIEKSFVAGLGIRTAPYAAVSQPIELAAALGRIGRPAWSSRPAASVTTARARPTIRTAS